MPNPTKPTNNEETSSEKRFMITTRSGEKLKLDKATVVKYITNNVDVSDAEFNMFFQLCKAHKVNPFLKEAYLIKYGNTPATIVLDYKVLQQIAEENPSYVGMKHGVVVMAEDGTVTERNGEYKLPGETLIAGWCEVYRTDRDHPTRVTAQFDEFKATKSNGEVNSNWASKPCFMICKVAKAQALREAFPNMVGSNVYISEEMDSVKEPTPSKPASKTTVNNDIMDVDEDGVVHKEEEPSNNAESGE